MSETNKFYQYDRNDNNTFGVRGAASGGGTEVVANPEGEATADLEKLQVGESIYGIPEGTNVVANPTLAGTESALAGLQVGETKYKVPVGYEIHTYTAGKTYTSSDTDYEQLRDDVTNRRMIKIGYYYFVVGNVVGGTLTYLSSNTSMGIITLYGVYIDISSSSVTIGNVTSGKEVHQVTPQTQFSGTNLTAVSIDSTTYNFVSKETRYLTTAPSSANTSGYLQFVVLTAEPATYYDGYYYIIAPST